MHSEHYQKWVKARTLTSLKRKRHITEPGTLSTCIVKGKKCIDFTSNDYLGLRHHPAVNQALVEGVSLYGLGSGGSALVSGYTPAHQALEEHFATWLGVDRCLLFSSGYLANIGVIPALCGRSQMIYSDRLCHASILDGITLSRAKNKRYRHNCIESLTALIQQTRPDLIVTESLFSMEGDIAPLATLSQLAKDNHTHLIIDEAHAVGVLGPTGKGAVEHYQLTQDDYAARIVPLGKAFNAMGAIVAGRTEIIETLLQLSRSYCYNTALPPAICHGLLTTLALIEQESWRRAQLLSNCEFFNAYAKQADLPLLNHDPTPIRSILVHENDKAVQLQKWLCDQGFFVSAIRPPTVPHHQARTRLSISCHHSTEQIEQLINLLRQGLTTLGDHHD